jgi:hypothetical protein
MDAIGIYDVVGLGDRLHVVGRLAASVAADNPHSLTLALAVA